MPRFPGPTILAALLGVGLMARPASAAAQIETGAITGSVRDAESGRALAHATVMADRRASTSDSLGRFSLSGISSGRVRVLVRAIGYDAFDTTLAVASGSGTSLGIRLEQAGWVRQSHVAAAKNIAAGKIDSAALGLLHHTPADSSLTFDAFGARLLRETARQRDSDSNTVLSPTSAAFALSIALLGARGATEQEIAAVLGAGGLDRATLRRRTAAAMSAGAHRSDVQLEIANAMWVDTAFRLRPDFIVAAAFYNASARTLPLSSPSIVAAVNAWADSATHGKIPRVLEKSLADSATLFIANAVYFNGKWLDEFDTSRTRRRDFRLASGKTVRVDAMERQARLGYGRGPGYQMIRLPYRGGRFAMYVVLPDSGTAALAIPRNPEQPDPLCISKVSQNVYLDVDEKGTEAAAFTGLTVGTVVSLGPPPIEFIVDRPYLFMVRDEATGANVFVGTIRQP